MSFGYRGFFEFCWIVALLLALTCWDCSTAVNNTTCSALCQQTDTSDQCWKNTQAYFDEQLAQALNDWVAIQVNFDQWNRRNNAKNYNKINISDYGAVVTETVDQISQYFATYFVFTSEMLKPIVELLLNDTGLVIVHKQTSADDHIIYVDMPEFKCPIPCDYESRMWEYLFIASLLVNIALVLVVIPFIVKTERRDKQLYAKQINMMQMVKPKSRTSSLS